MRHVNTITDAVTIFKCYDYVMGEAQQGMTHNQATIQILMCIRLNMYINQ